MKTEGKKAKSRKPVTRRMFWVHPCASHGEVLNPNVYVRVGMYVCLEVRLPLWNVEHREFSV